MWATPELDLRRTLNDSATDKLRHRKKVFGQVNGVNTVFKTLEFRRITDLTVPTGAEGVYVNNILSTVTTDLPEVGEFILAVPPTDGDIVESTYYVQYFLDAELTGFMVDAAEWIGIGGTYTNIEEGLRPAAIQYGAYLGYQKLAMRFHENLSETFRLEDSPNKGNIEYLNWLLAMAEGFLKRATALRKNFYERNDQASAPLYAISVGRVNRNVPNK